MRLWAKPPAQFQIFHTFSRILLVPNGIPRPCQPEHGNDHSNEKDEEAAHTGNGDNPTQSTVILNRAVDGKFGWVARLPHEIPPVMRVTRQVTSALYATDAKC